LPESQAQHNDLKKYHLFKNVSIKILIGYKFHQRISFCLNALLHWLKARHLML
jgi:hypothetical protein